MHTISRILNSVPRQWHTRTRYSYQKSVCGYSSK